MRTALGIIIGLVIGCVIGVIAVDYFNDRQVQVIQKASRAAPSYSESYFVCKPAQADKGSGLIIKSDSTGAKAIVFAWKTDADTFSIEQTTDLHYLANEPNFRANEAYTSIDLNRVTGEMIITDRRPTAAMKLLQSICDKRTPVDQCVSQMNNISGGDTSDCSRMANDLIVCPYLNTVNNISGRFSYRCASAERRF